MRRSGRSRKPREFFRPAEAIPEEVSGEMSDEDEMAPPKGRPAIAAPRARGAGRPRPSVESTFTAGTTAKRRVLRKDLTFTYEGARCKLFDAMLMGSGVAEVRAAAGMFERNPIAAVAELINFVLLAAGATKKWIGSRVELEGLEPEELDELLRDMVAAATEGVGAPVPPLQAPPSKKGVSLREGYFNMWIQFVDVVHSPLTQGFRLGSTETTRPAVAILDMLLGVLVALSSNGLAAVRDAATEAALAVGQGALAVAVAHRAKKDLAARQLKAEELKGKASRQTPKYKSIEKQVQEQEQTMEEFTALADLVFHSIYAHRYKDTQPSLRAGCCRRLGQWLRIDPVRLMEDTYLKYLGWMCSDRAANVRLEAVESISVLCDDPNSSSLLESFLDRFVGRVLEMAAADVNERVALAAVTCLRKAQRFGALDEVDGDSIAAVDGVVFDPGCPSAVRSQALLFMMEHTEGFEFLLAGTADERNGQSEERTTKRSAKKRRVSGPDLESRRNVLLALETLTEYMEDAHESTAERDEEGRAVQCMAAMLVQAFDGLPEAISGLLREWDAMVSLLLKESEVFSSGHALSAFHSTALLRLMLESARGLHARLADGGGGEAVQNSWSELQSTLGGALSRLFTRFGDDERNLLVLSSLLAYTDVSRAASSSGCLKVTVELFARCRDEALLFNLCSAWSGWAAEARAEGGVVGQAVVKSVSRAAGEQWALLEEHRVVLEERAGAAVVGRKKKKGNATPLELEDTLLSVAVEASRLCILLRNADCRDAFDDKDSISPVYSLEAIANVSAELLEASVSQAAAAAAVGALQGAARCLFAWMLWAVRDCRSETPPEGNMDGGVLERLVTVRETLQAVLFKALKAGTDWDPATPLGRPAGLGALRREAFALIGDMRVLFFPVDDLLHWTPPQDTMAAMRTAFDSESAALSARLVECGAGPDAEDLSRSLADSLLLPLQTVQVLDMQHLNRRQGAAVLRFLADTSESIAEVVKTYCRKLKEADPVKYLEVQMVALKSMFGERALEGLTELRTADRPESQTEYSASEVGALEEAVEEGAAALQQFAVRVAQTFGVGKLKGEAAQALVLFFRVGIDFAMADPLHMSFLTVLEPYVRYLSASLLGQVAEYFQDCSVSPSLPAETTRLLLLDRRDVPMRAWYAPGLRAFQSIEKILSKRSNINKSQLDISEITRDTSRVDYSYRSAAVPVFDNGHVERGRESELSKVSSDSLSNDLHAHTKSYGSKRRRSDSLSSAASGGALEESFPAVSPILSSGRPGVKRGYAELSADEEQDQQRSRRPDSHTKPSRIFEERRRPSAPAQSQPAAPPKAAVQGGRRSTRSTGSAKNYSDHSFDLDGREASMSGDEVAYGLHLEDPFGDSGRRSSRSGRSSRGSASGGGSLRAPLSSALFAEEDSEEEEEAQRNSVVIPPSTRNRNR